MFFFNFEEDKLKNYYLAYFDILGYNNYFDKVQLVDEKIHLITTVHSKLIKVEVACK